MERAKARRATEQIQPKRWPLPLQLVANFVEARAVALSLTLKRQRSCWLFSGLHSAVQRIHYHASLVESSNLPLQLNVFRYTGLHSVQATRKVKYQHPRASGILLSLTLSLSLSSVLSTAQPFLGHFSLAAARFFDFISSTLRSE